MTRSTISTSIPLFGVPGVSLVVEKVIFEDVQHILCSRFIRCRFRVPAVSRILDAARLRLSSADRKS